MFKAVILLFRGDDMSAADFRRWWLDEHAPLAAQLPDVRRVVFNTVADDTTGQPGAASADEPDGVSELWFDTKEAFERAYASEIGRRVAADSMAHVRARVRLLVTEHLVVGS